MTHSFGVLFVKTQLFALLSPLPWQKLMSATGRHDRGSRPVNHTI